MGAALDTGQFGKGMGSGLATMYLRKDKRCLSLGHEVGGALR